MRISEWWRLFPLILLLLLSSLWLMPSAAAQSEERTQDLVPAAVQNEGRMLAGEVTFYVEVEGKPIEEHGMYQEVGEGVYVKYAWDDKDRFRATIQDKDGTVLRTIVFDGTNIDTGDSRIWDRRYFLADGSFDAFESRESRRVYSEFIELLWPHLMAVEHLFPISHRGYIDDMDYSTLMFLYEVRDVTEDFRGASSGPTATIELRMRPRSILTSRITFDLSTGNGIPIEREDMIPFQDIPYVNFQYSKPMNVQDNTWVSTICRRTYLFGTSQCSVVSTLLPERSRFGVQQPESAFTITGRANKTIVSVPKPSVWSRCSKALASLTSNFAQIVDIDNGAYTPVHKFVIGCGLAVLIIYGVASWKRR